VSDPRLLRAIVAEVRRARRALDSLETIAAQVARFAVKLDELPVLCAADTIRPLVEATTLDERIAPAVEHLERIPEEDLTTSARGATDWRDWLRPPAALGGAQPTASAEMQQTRPGQTPATTGSARSRRAHAQGTAIPRAAYLPPQIHQRQGYGPGAGAIETPPPQTAHLVTPEFDQSSIDTAGSRLREESKVTTAGEGNTPVWVAPAVRSTGVSQRLLSAVERAERARRERSGLGPRHARRSRALESRAEEREPAPPPAPAPVESVTRSPVPSGTGLRRLASLASVSITHAGPLGLEGSVAPPPRGSTVWNSPERPTRGIVEDDFAEHLLDALRGEAERHGIDPEGSIR
jgi:hypothetical protein